MNTQDYWNYMAPLEQDESSNIKQRYLQEQAIADMVRQMQGARDWHKDPSSKLKDMERYAELGDYKARPNPGIADNTRWYDDRNYADPSKNEAMPSDHPRYYRTQSFQGSREGYQPTGEQRRDQNLTANKYSAFSEIMPRLQGGELPGGVEAKIASGAPPSEAYPGEMQNYEHGTMSPNETPTGSMSDFLSSIAGGVGRAAKGAYDTVMPSGVDTSSLQNLAEDLGLPESPRMPWRAAASIPGAMPLYAALNQPLDPISLAMLAAGAKGAHGKSIGFNPKIVQDFMMKGRPRTRMVPGGTLNPYDPFRKGLPPGSSEPLQLTGGNLRLPSSPPSLLAEGSTTLNARRPSSQSPLYDQVSGPVNYYPGPPAPPEPPNFTMPNFGWTSGNVPSTEVFPERLRRALMNRMLGVETNPWSTL